MKTILLGMVVMATGIALCDPTVHIQVTGREKFSVQISVGNPEFSRCLARNLELSGLFEVRGGGGITVSGASGSLRAEGCGKAVGVAEQYSDAASARMAARKLSDAMCKAYGNQEGFACDRLLFLNRGKSLSQSKVLPSELCVSYPDGMDASQLTGDAKMSVYPRWMRDGRRVLYINDRSGSPQVWMMDTETRKRTKKWSFKGTVTGLAVAPDGNRVATILSVHGNPELYVINNVNSENPSWTRLTNTEFATEGQPTWSPDGRQIAYVSDETRRPQIYVVDVATKAKRRLTSNGRENIDPDWGKDGRIAYITKRAGSQIAVMKPAEGDRSAIVVKAAGNWEHPSWSRDGRHLAANSNGALFIVDTLEDGDKPRQAFSAKGNWISPCWMK